MRRSRVLVVGLDPRRVPGPWDPEPLVASIADGMARFAEHDVDAQACLVGLDGSDDIPQVVAAALRAQDWDCVVIGGGIRNSEDLLPLFEQIVNWTRQLAPHAAIAFSDAPTRTYEAAARWLASGGPDSPATLKL